MEKITRRICLEELTSREEATFGQLTSDYLYFKIPLTQTYDNMGEFTDLAFIPAQVLDRDLTIEEKFLRLDGATEQHYYEEGSMISGYTDSKVEVVRSYDIANPFQPTFDIERGQYLNFSAATIDGATRVTELSTGGTITYVVDAHVDGNIGTSGQTTGLLYDETYPNSGEPTRMRYFGEGWNMTNSSLAAIYKEEYLMGIISHPEVKSDVFIDRGVTTVMEVHLRMSEIENLNHLERYGNGFYRIKRS